MPRGTLVAGEMSLERTQNGSTRMRLVSIDRALWVIATLLILGVLYVARLFLLPIVMSVLFALTLSPMVRVARRRGIPNAITASALVVSVSFLAIAAVYLLSGPVVAFVERAPVIMLEVNRKLEHLRTPLENVSRASKQLSELSAGEPDPSVQDVRVEEPGLIVEAADEMLTFGGIALVTVVLTLFLLVYNTLIYEKIVQAVPRFSDKKVAVQTIHEIEREISRYLLSITLINLGLGIAVAVAMWLLEMPSPYLWGIMAAALNFMPYVGAIIGAIVLALVALVSIEPVGQAMLVPLVYLFLTSVEGQFITPAVVGNRLSLNPLVIVIAVAFWAWIWGIAGVLVAVPLLIIARILSEQLPALAALGHAISLAAVRQSESE
ncbi:MAG: AI-2E family transporter [Rhizobiaceae bacterium]|nr:AI-2E family transporter [Rhizobiaceae bacterium]